MKPTYRIEVYNNDDELLAILDKFTMIKINQELNKGSRLDFTVVGADDKATQDNLNGRNYIKLYRNDSLFWAGQIMLVSINLKESVQFSVTCWDWFSLLKFRYVTKAYLATDAGAIAWDLINETQTKTNGDLGIIQGAIETTKDRDRTYEVQEVGAAIENLTNVDDGFDFEITPAKVFNVYAYKGSDKTGTIQLKTDNNIDTFDLKIDNGQVANYVVAIGDGNLDKNASDTPSQEYFGRREKIVKELNWKDPTTIQDKANESINRYKWTAYDIQVKLTPHVDVPDLSDIALGDIIKVVADLKSFTYSDSVRVYGYSVNYSKDGVEQIELKVNQII